MNVIQPLRPLFPGWSGGEEVGWYLKSEYSIKRWRHEKNAILVLSAVKVANDKDGIDRGPEYHLSMSKSPRLGMVERCSAEEAAWVLAQFGMEGGEEDNHVDAGKVRNFWRPVADHLVGLKCPCKENEQVVMEGDYEYRPLK